LQFENACMANEAGIYPSENLATFRTAVAGWMSTPGGAAWWKERRAWFGTLAQQAIDDALQNVPPQADSAGPTQGRRVS
ncbi:MAG: hypothetical protein ABFS41_02100, partial [Myxococcota bacterium]